MKKHFKKGVVTVLKLSLAAALIVWLVSSGKLDFSQLAVAYRYPSILIATVAYWLVCLVLLGAQRWRLLVKAVGYKLSWRRAIHLQQIGFFFNTTMPGAVGGDLIKVYYVIRDNKDKGKSLAFLSILLDRLVGLGGVFSIGLFVIFTHFSQVLASPILMSLLSMLLSFVLCLVVFFGAALYRYRGEDPFLKLLKLPIWGFSFIRHLYEALREYRNHRRVVWYALLISIFNQMISLSLFCLITNKMLPDQAINWAGIATIFPLGALVTALPIAPGGLGLGHVAFENLFRMIGLTQGANVFNLFTLTQLTLNVTGVIPYLYLKKGKEMEGGEEAVVGSSV